VEILGSLLMHLGGHVSLGINPHTRIYSPKFHPIINNNSELTRLAKLVYSMPKSLDSRMEGRTQLRKPASSTYPYVQPSLSSVLIKHSAFSARFCSTTFTSYPITTTALISKYKLPKTNTITGTASAESQ
jgi:hypothetical protein